MIDADNTDDLALLANTPGHSEYLVRGIGPNINANKTKYICFKQKGAISILNGKPLKF